MPEGTIGQIFSGPVEADGYVWWEVDYVVGVRGWSAESWLDCAPSFQPPVADFAFYPKQPKAGEEVTFDASASYNLRTGEIISYEWDWNGDWDFDEYTTSPTIAFWWLEEGTYTVRLRVIDDVGAVNITSKDITVSKTTFWWMEDGISGTSEIMISRASGVSRWPYIIYGWDDGLAISQIDTWIRSGKGKPLDWLKPYDAKDLDAILNKEVDPAQSPRLTYKTFARSKIFEGNLIAEASVFYRDPDGHVREEVIKPLFIYVFNSVGKMSIDITKDAIKILNPILGYGLESILIAKKLADLGQVLEQVTDRMNKQYFMNALAWYLFMRGINKEPALAWDYCLKWVELAISAQEVPIAEGKKREDMLTFIQSYFERLWGDYEERLMNLGLWESFLQADKQPTQESVALQVKARILLG